MTEVKDKVPAPRASQPLYDSDFFAWTIEQSDALSRKQAGAIDWKNLAEEVRSLGSNDKNEIESRLLVLLVHLLEASPSLAGYPSEVLAEEYADARFSAGDETGLPMSSFPEICPFTATEVLDPDFWPEDRSS